MAKSMFSREVALKLEGELNAFQACRSLSHRARDINTERNLHEAEGEIPEEDHSFVSRTCIWFAFELAAECVSNGRYIANE